MAINSDDLLDLWATVWESAPPSFKRRVQEMEAIMNAERREEEMDQQELHDSGERRTFSSGAVRDRGSLKPRPDLISPHAQMREGMIFALGAEKYDTRNWELGMEISECLASAQRHIEQWKLGLKDEDHLAQARWNLGAIIHYEEEIAAGRMDPVFADMPHYTRRPTREILGGLVDTTLKDMPDPTESSPVEERACPQCNHAPVQIVLYETGPEQFCRECYWSSLDPEPYHGDEPEFSQPDRKTFYICGPMRDLPFLNFPAFDGAKKLGESLGHNIISPADMDRMYGIDPIEDPGSPERIRNATPNFVQNIVQRDVEVILYLRKDRGDGLALLPGWQESVGGMAEVRLAYWLGLTFVDACTWNLIDIEVELGIKK